MEEIYKFWGCESSPGKCSSVEIKILYKAGQLQETFASKIKLDCQTEHILIFGIHIFEFLVLK